ncbi:MAG: alpha/beta hydrolase [Gemmatimonadaceae bacterium]
MILPIVAASIVAVAGLVLRVVAARRIERAISDRLPLNPDGIVRGAASISLHRDDAAHAVLVIHGFGDTPQSMSYLAEYLHARGYAVSVPLLPGHGRTLRAFGGSQSDEWINAARDELKVLRGRHRHVSIAGLSMGGAIAAILAAEYRDVSSLVLLAPFFEASAAVRLVASVPHIFAAIFPFIAGSGERSIRDPAERARNLAYRASTPAVVRELTRLANRARSALPGIEAPVLIIQSRKDYRVAPAVAERALNAVGSLVKRVEWLENSGHVISVDFGRERVFALAAEWMEMHCGKADLAAADTAITND